MDQNAFVDMFFSLRLFLVLVDDLPEDFVVFVLGAHGDDFPNNVDATHQDLVQMSVFHQMREILQNVFENGPNFTFECLFADLKAMAQVF